MSINQLYLTWFQQIRQLRPDERVTRICTFVWLMVGIYHSRSVHLSKVASKIPGRAVLVSTARRLSRWLDNPAVRVREWYAPVAGEVVRAVAASTREVRLIADGSRVGFGHQLLMLSLAFRRRAIPLAWTWVKCPKGHSSATKQLALLAYVRSLMPRGIPVLLVGDSEFGAMAVLEQLDAWQWRYVLRQRASHGVQLEGQTTWQTFGSLIQRPGQSRWVERALLTGRSAYPTNLLAHWAIGEDEPWLLATNLPRRGEALQAYRRRMWIEEMFGDMKGHGFDLEKTHLHHFLRLSRLTLAVVFLYLWLISVGTKAIRRGQRRLVDRNDRRDLSIFQIGWRIVDRCLTNALEVPMILRPCQ
jgi:Transposase DDE domain